MGRGRTSTRNKLDDALGNGGKKEENRGAFWRTIIIAATDTPRPHPHNALLFPCCISMAGCNRSILALLVYGILTHYSVHCSPIGLSYPKVRLDNEPYGDGNTLPKMYFDNDQMLIRSPPSLEDDVYTEYYPTEKRTERHAEDEVGRQLREILGHLTARQYLTSLMTIHVGDYSSLDDQSEMLSKRHSDGVFTDSYSRYRKQMAVKKYLAAVLGRRYRQRVRNKGRSLTYL
ncbi:hypothetical protein UPYG_G00304130 [Umbra pygmaea]|uniref:Glucagon / GIP / secretin / VIP family domain-containing protein n=1 Tax=Umbra pygmaea TaxID=75934 RepID=A0ABD0WS00_UMBPY